jgi:hypothetical protein
MPQASSGLKRTAASIINAPTSAKSAPRAIEPTMPSGTTIRRARSLILVTRRYFSTLRWTPWTNQHHPDHQDDDADSRDEQSASGMPHQLGGQAARLVGLALVPSRERREGRAGE